MHGRPNGAVGRPAGGLSGNLGGRPAHLPPGRVNVCCPVRDLVAVAAALVDVVLVLVFDVFLVLLLLLMLLSSCLRGCYCC